MDRHKQMDSSTCCSVAGALRTGCGVGLLLYKDFISGEGGGASCKWEQLLCLCSGLQRPVQFLHTAGCPCWTECPEQSTSAAEVSAAILCLDSDLKYQMGGLCAWPPYEPVKPESAAGHYYPHSISRKLLMSFVAYSVSKECLLLSETLRLQEELVLVKLGLVYKISRSPVYCGLVQNRETTFPGVQKVFIPADWIALNCPFNTSALSWPKVSQAFR